MTVLCAPKQGMVFPLFHVNPNYYPTTKLNERDVYHVTLIKVGSCMQENSFDNFSLVWSGSLRIFVNLELDLWFGSGKGLNLGLDHRFRSSSGLNLFEPVNFPTQFSTQKEGLGYF